MSRLNDQGLKLKQLSIPMDLYRLLQKRCLDERDTNESRMILKYLRKALLTFPPDIPNEEPLPDIAPPLFVSDDEGLPEIVRLRKIFPDNEPEVQKQLKEIEQGLKDAGMAEEDIRLTLYGSEGKDE